MQDLWQCEADLSTGSSLGQTVSRVYFRDSLFACSRSTLGTLRLLWSSHNGTNLIMKSHKNYYMYVHNTLTISGYIFEVSFFWSSKGLENFLEKFRPHGGTPAAVGSCCLYVYCSDVQYTLHNELFALNNVRKFHSALLLNQHFLTPLTPLEQKLNFELWEKCPENKVVGIFWTWHKCFISIYK